MEKVEQIIDTLRIKIEQLVEENDELKQRVSALIEQSAYFKGLSEDRKKAIADLTSQSQAITAAGQMIKHTDSEQVRARIDEFVREIDKCINLLSR